VPLSAADTRTLIARELGKLTDLPFQRLVEQLWELHDDRSLISPRLQYLYTKRAAVEALISQNWELHDAADEGVKESFRQQIQNLEGQAERLSGEIKTVETRTAGSRPPASGQLTTTTVYTNRTGQPDPNARHYRGDPLKGGRRFLR